MGLLGPEGTFSSEAADNYIKRKQIKVRIKYYTTIADCFNSLRKGETDRILVPLFNSIIGFIAETVQYLNGFKICDTETLQIVLHLAGSGSLSSVKYIHSKKEVAQQCQRYLSKKDIALVFENSTAMAALKVKGLADRAAIISKRASEIYGLRILESDIQDSKDNVTEFIVLSH